MGTPDCHNTREYTMTYPEPPHYSSTPMDHLGVSPEPFSAYARSSHEYPTTTGYENGSVYGEPPYVYGNGRGSPGVYPDDSDLRGPSSDLSIASASSSNMGSPLSSHGQMAAPIPEWAAAPNGLGATPGIVDQGDYFPGGGEYSFAPGAVEAFQTSSYDFPPAKGPGFVGELAQIPRSSRLVSSPFAPDSVSTMVRPTSPSPGLAVDTRVARQVSASAFPPGPPSASSPSAASGHVFTPPPAAAPSFSSSSSSSSSSTSTSSFTCTSNPTASASASSRAAWGSSPARPNMPSSRLVTPFFSQSSGHFVPPLESSYPSLIHPDVRPMAMPGYEHSYPPPPNSAYPTSPALSVSASPQPRAGSTSPFMHHHHHNNNNNNNNNYQPYSPFQPPLGPQRRGSLVSFQSNYSGEQTYSGDESKEKQRCPHLDCGKAFKDLKAHMLTHQTERPEKCPITTCEYHVKGFARKYDKNRHTLTHYKGTMVCGFCPGSGSAAEKSFNRADVFKRHLTAVHGVEQTPPNSRKKSGASASSGGSNKLAGYAPDATARCSTCSRNFDNAQDFYEHLDDCVLRIVQQEDPAEAINAQRLAEVENDREVHKTLEKNNLPTTTITTTTTTAIEDGDDEDEPMDDDELDGESRGAGGAKGSLASPTKRTKGGNPVNGVQKSRGMTHSHGGVPLQTKSRGRKSRRDYPSSWGFDKGQMTIKKRVLAVFDGPRRLAKDDMMLSTEQEVRIKLRDGKSYVTDLDLQTLKRAEGFLGATDEEKGPWVSDDPTDEQLQQMLEFNSAAAAAAATVSSATDASAVPATAAATQ
ncbi:hypothetical protein VTK26DRAFT_8104 [Humicola hyalothermophila]